MSQEHEFQIVLSFNVTDLSILSCQIEREKIFEFFVIFVFFLNYIILPRGSVRYEPLNLLLANVVFTVLFLEIDFLVQNLVSQSNDSPPEDLARHFVELLAKLVQDSWSSFTVECPSIVVRDNNLLLALELPSIELV